MREGRRLPQIQIPTALRQAHPSVQPLSSVASGVPTLPNIKRSPFSWTAEAKKECADTRCQWWNQENSLKAGDSGYPATLRSGDFPSAKGFYRYIELGDPQTSSSVKANRSQKYLYSTFSSLKFDDRDDLDPKYSMLGQLNSTTKNKRGGSKKNKKRTREQERAHERRSLPALGTQSNLNSTTNNLHNHLGTSIFELPPITKHQFRQHCHTDW